MREIKFRGMRISDGEWVYGDFFRNRGLAFIATDGIEKNPLAKWQDYHVDPETVGQYTGLHDKDGREIYEGDILNIDFKKELMYVDYVKDGFMVCQKGSLNDFLYTVAADSRIVGNIHDNPELLR